MSAVGESKHLDMGILGIAIEQPLDSQEPSLRTERSGARQIGAAA